MSETNLQIAGSDADALKPVGLRELVRYFLRLGSFGFGGPIALACYLFGAVALITVVARAEIALLFVIAGIIGGSALLPAEELEKIR